jgi:hypothetical protein
MSDQGSAVGDIDTVERQEENDANVKEEEKIEAMAVDGRASGLLKRSARKVLFKRKMTRLRKFISKGWLQIFYLDILWMICRTYVRLFVSLGLYTKMTTLGCLTIIKNKK